MTEELTDKDPFDDDDEVKEEDLITEGMVKKATYLIHKLAEQKGKEYKDIQKKCRSLFRYENLAKISKEQGHAIIDKLLELTGGEEHLLRSEEKPPQQGATVTDDGSEHQKTEEPKTTEEKITVQDESPVTSAMREAIRAAVDITLREVVAKDVPVQGLGGFVLEIGKVIFEANMAQEAGK